MKITADNKTYISVSNMFSSMDEDINNDHLKESDLRSIERRSRTYSNYLNEYINHFKEKSKQQRGMKIAFFVVILVLLAAVVCGSIAVFIVVATKKDVSVADIATLISATGGLISAFIILPKVIAINLFPQKEEDITADLFEKMFDHDMQLRGIYHAPSAETTDDDTGTDKSVD